jgi:chorismate mutase
MSTKKELETRVAEIDDEYAAYMKERQDIVAQTHPAGPEAKRRVAEIDSAIITLMNERGDCVEKAHSLLLADARTRSLD